MRLSQIAPIVPCPPSLLARQKIVRGESTVYRRAVRSPITLPRHAVSVTPARFRMPTTIAYARPCTFHNDVGPSWHAVHAANRVMAARRRPRYTSPAKMAIFETRNRRAVHAHTPIPAAWLYHACNVAVRYRSSAYVSYIREENRKCRKIFPVRNRTRVLAWKKARSETDYVSSRSRLLVVDVLDHRRGRGLHLGETRAWLRGKVSRGRATRD